MTGEETQFKGVLGARDAKRWLDRTTRVEVRWVNPDPAAVKKLNFQWPVGGSFSFDLAGIFQGGDLDGEMFLAEVKNYDTYSDLNQHYEQFVAQAYVANGDKLADKFLFISWHPFHATNWSKLKSYEFIEECIVKNRKKIFGEGVDKETAKERIDDEICKKLTSKIWVLVLSREQIDHLMLSNEHFGVVIRHIKESEGL